MSTAPISQPRCKAESASVAMVWTSIPSIDITPLLQNITITPAYRSNTDFEYNLTNEELGLVYHLQDTMVSTRPTLLKPRLLYAVICIQPFPLHFLLGLSFLLYFTPVEKGFALIPILSSVDRDNLDTLARATLSGRLQEDIELIIHPLQEGNSSIRYCLARVGERLPGDGFLDAGTLYF
jgi:hypothetical protein